MNFCWPFLWEHFHFAHNTWIFVGAQTRPQVFCLYHNTPQEKNSHFHATILQQALHKTEILAKKCKSASSSFPSSIQFRNVKKAKQPPRIPQEQENQHFYGQHTSSLLHTSSYSREYSQNVTSTWTRFLSHTCPCHWKRQYTRPDPESSTIQWNWLLINNKLWITNKKLH